MNSVYFDHAATSFPKPDCVPQAVLRYLTQVGGNVNRGAYSSALAAERVVFETRVFLTELFHGDDCKNTVFTSGVTASLNILLKGLFRSGDHVLVSAMEHNAVMRPLTQLAARGVSFTRIPCSAEGCLNPADIPPLIKKETRAVILTHASNVCGTLLPLKETGRLCREHGLYFLVDAAQTAGVFPLDMQELCIDALAFTGHKGLLGPQGTGGFLLRQALIPEIEPLLSGGTGSVSHLETVPDFMPDRFEPGTPNLPGIFGLHAALTWLKETGIDRIRGRELALTDLFLDGLKQIPGVRIIGKRGTDGRAPVVSVQLPGIDQAQASFLLASEYGIAIRSGLHCAPNAHKTLGTYPEGTLRFSFGYENTEAEVQAALRALSELSGTAG